MNHTMARVLRGKRDAGPNGTARASGFRMAKIGRNDPCPCGSGEKYKRCHLAVDAEIERASMEPSGPFVQARPIGPGGLVEVILPALGTRIPEHGYDDCPICRAETPEERIRLIFEHSGQRRN